MIKTSRKVMAIFFLFIMTSCTVATGTVPVSLTLDATALYLTSAAQVTEANAQTLTVEAFENTAIAVAKTAKVTPTPIPTIDRTRPSDATPTRQPDCDSASAGSPFDVSIRDHTEMIPGQNFTKTWRLVNAGSCKWTRLYKLVFFSGNSLQASFEQNLHGEVLPGSSIDLSVSMIAPITPGIYQGNWMLQNEKGEQFGIGPNADAPFWVIIDVVNQATPTITPTPSPTRTPTIQVLIYKQGSLEMSSTQKVDLDEGLITTGDAPFDLEYSFLGGSHILMPGSLTGILPFGSTAPTFGDCQALNLANNGIVYATISGYEYICYKTDQNRMGSLRIISFNETSGILTLEFLTWTSQ
jgi:hypothetical protein